MELSGYGTAVVRLLYSTQSCLFFSLRAYVFCIVLLAPSSWLPRLDGTHVCTSVYQLYFLHIRHKPLHMQQPVLQVSDYLFSGGCLSRTDRGNLLHSLTTIFHMFSTDGCNLTLAIVIVYDLNRKTPRPKAPSPPPRPTTVNTGTMTFIPIQAPRCRRVKRPLCLLQWV